MSKPKTGHKGGEGRVRRGPSLLSTAYLSLDLSIPLYLIPSQYPPIGYACPTVVRLGLTLSRFPLLVWFPLGVYTKEVRLRRDAPSSKCN